MILLNCVLNHVYIELFWDQMEIGMFSLESKQNEESLKKSKQLIYLKR